MGGQALDSMDKAIDAIKFRSMQVFKFFLVQLIAFHLSSFMLMWICYEAIVALIVNIVLAIFWLSSCRTVLTSTASFHLRKRKQHQTNCFKIHK
jgi:hypothetical protein